MNHVTKSLLVSIAILALLSVPLFSAEEKAVTPTEHPFLWVIPDDPPAFLFGTIHLPDDRVLALPEIVTTAFDASDVVCTELHMDMETQTKAAMAFMLPGDKTLADILPKDLYERTDKYFQSKGYSLALFQKFKVYAIAMQLMLLDYLPEFATKQPLDAMLYSNAEKQGKETDALETVEEQIDIFESFTEDEQVEILRETLDQLEGGGAQYGEKMIQAYLAGDGDRLWKVMYEYVDPDNPVDRKFMRIAITERNQRMADRIGERLKNNEDKIYFFAIGAAHYDREDGILALLKDMGYAPQRLNASDLERLQEILGAEATVQD